MVAADNRALNATLVEGRRAQGDMDARGPPPGCATPWPTAYRGHAQTPRRLGRACRATFRSETFAERPPVVERICEVLDKGFRPCDIMILVRGATDGAKVAAELLDFKRRNEDPRYRFDVMTQEALIVGNAPVSSFIAAALRLALNPDDSLSRRRLQPLPRSRVRPPAARRTNATFFRSIRLLSPEEAFERIVMRARAARRPAADGLPASHPRTDHRASARAKIADIALFLRLVGAAAGKNRSL